MILHQYLYPILSKEGLSDPIEINQRLSAMSWTLINNHPIEYISNYILEILADILAASMGYCLCPLYCLFCLCLSKNKKPKCAVSDLSLKHGAKPFSDGSLTPTFLIRYVFLNAYFSMFWHLFMILYECLNLRRPMANCLVYGCLRVYWNGPLSSIKAQNDSVVPLSRAEFDFRQRMLRLSGSMSFRHRYCFPFSG